MSVYIVSLLFVYLCASLMDKDPNGVMIQRKRNNFKNKLLLVLILTVLILIPSLRYHVGTDYSTYEGLFSYYMSVPFSKAILKTEGAFWSISSIIGLLTNDVHWVFAIHAIYIVTIFVLMISKKSIRFELSLFLYITMLDYFSSFNGIRQWAAASILFLGMDFIKGKKWLQFFIIVAIAFFFHRTSIIMVPGYFFVTRKAWSKIIIWSSLIFVAFVLIFPNVLELLFNIAEGSDYQHYLVYNPNDDGVHPLKILIAFIPVAISFFYYKQLFKNDEEKKWLDILINFSILNFLVWFLGIRSTVIVRLAMYFSPYNALLIPYFLRIFSRKSRSTAKIIFMALFFLYMYLVIPVDSNLLPYRTFL